MAAFNIYSGFRNIISWVLPGAPGQSGVGLSGGAALDFFCYYIAVVWQPVYL